MKAWNQLPPRGSDLSTPGTSARTTKGAAIVAPKIAVAAITVALPGVEAPTVMTARTIGAPQV